MPSYYNINSASLGKIAHHTGMADVHAHLASEYYQKKEKLSANSASENSRSMHFYDAAMAHHRHEISYNENQSREHRAGRSFESIARGGAAQPDDDLMRQPTPRTISTSDTGRMTSTIPQQNTDMKRQWAEQGNKAEVRDSGGTTPVDPALKGKRFM